MREELFHDLLQSVEEAGVIRKGKQQAERISMYKGKILIEVREKGKIVWSLNQAATDLRTRKTFQGLENGSSDPRSIREALGQTQEGFAELLGVSVRTLQNWEQGRRKPVGPARRLLDVARFHPIEVLDVALTAH